MRRRDRGRKIVVRHVTSDRKVYRTGAWKLAYADFMTAMMAFFLLMWLVSMESRVQIQGVADFFKQPLKLTLWGGERSAVDSGVLKAGGRDVSTDRQGDTQQTDGHLDRGEHSAQRADDNTGKLQSRDVALREQLRLHDLQIKLMAALQANPDLRQFRQQIRIDSTLMGLRIEIVDSQKRPMFATARDTVEPYMHDILRAIGGTLNSVPNRIIVQGHTDAVPYPHGEKGYSNWELSTDRANASRRELIAGGLDTGKVMRVIGLAATQNLNKADPLDPENRRISIIVLNKRSEEALMQDNTSTTTVPNDAAGAGKSPLSGLSVSAATTAPR
ncbi:flagellar motor protein MotB [Paraburkholderia denitrificans]|uniref:Flagellar motor protein MotB n=1 Tax=Paraburkholderia denitrificans TaxID=694025 RepID=A0ABW0J9W7_9BURK